MNRVNENEGAAFRRDAHACPRSLKPHGPTTADVLVNHSAKRNMYGHGYIQFSDGIYGGFVQVQF